MRWLSVVIAVVVVSRPGTAFAYRPFDGTDADVAEEGTFELELGPVGYLHRPAYDSAVFPSLVLNQGIDDDVELVAQTNRLQLIGHPAGRRVVQYVDSAFLMKHIWRDGALQDESGPSIATELGPLFPTGPDDEVVGAIATTIVSVMTPATTLHFNVAPSLNTVRDFELFASTIIEGPHDWAVRPVSELYVDRDFRALTTYSALVGVLWVIRDGLEFDVGARAASVGGSLVTEGRFGITWAFQLWADNPGTIEGPATVHPRR